MATNIPVRNPNVRHTLRIKQQNAVLDEKTNKPIPNKWKDSGNVAFIKPGETVDCWVDEKGRRVVIEEMPT